MASMSYCRFENTVGDLRACVEDLATALDEDLTLEQFIESRSSQYEQAAVRKLYLLCVELVDRYEDLERF